MSLKLVIGNKNYSSWSLRAWLYLKESQLPFEEVRLSMFTDQWKQEIGKYTPAGRVPVLLDDAITVWDSLAIMDYVREHYPGSVGWPSDRTCSAHMRSIAAEMHSGFLAIREELPQNIRMRQQRSRDDFSSAAQTQIDRVEMLWRDCYEKYGGPWLCSEFSIADVMYAPVALRFVTYGIQLMPVAQQFVEAVQALESVQTWVQDSASEVENLSFIDALAPVSDTPLSFG